MTSDEIPELKGDMDRLKVTMFTLSKQLGILQQFLNLKFGREFAVFLDEDIGVDIDPSTSAIHRRSQQDNDQIQDSPSITEPGNSASYTIIFDNSEIVTCTDSGRENIFEHEKLLENKEEKFQPSCNDIDNPIIHKENKDDKDPSLKNEIALNDDKASKTGMKSRKTKLGSSWKVSIPKNTAGNIICELCNKEFLGPKAQRNLRTHQEVHNTDRKYECPHCDKKFAQKRPRRTHIQRIHEREKVRIHACPSCNKKFCSPQELTLHKRTHSGEKPFACDKCEYKCSQVYNLLRHQRAIHSEEKHFLCYQCGKSFTTQRSLTQHEEKQHSSNPFQEEIICDLCQDRFINKPALTKHFKKMHNINPNRLETRQILSYADRTEQEITDVEVTVTSVKIDEIPYVLEVRPQDY